MSHWQGAGCAPGYSREVEQSCNAVYAAREALVETMRKHYPKDAQVLVVHYRGAFKGVVLGHDPDGARIVVRNNATGKSKKWWAARVEMATPTANGNAA